MFADSKNIPNFSKDEIYSSVNRLYGISTQIQNLASYSDQNFLVTDSHHQKYVVKISSAGQTKEFLRDQQVVFEHLSRECPHYHFPKVIKSLEGEIIHELKATSGQTYYFRIFRFMDGVFLSATEEHNPKLLNKFGRFLATMDNSLSQIDQPAVHREIFWNLKNASLVLPYNKYIRDPAKRRLVEYFLLRFETNVIPVFPQLRKSIIHGDANDNNVLLNRKSSAKFDIQGIIDFGDMVYTATICELAIAATYIMFNKKDPVVTATHLINGYNEILPITETEADLLYDLICARLCISLVTSAYCKLEQPQNDYISISEKPGWRLLEQMLKINPMAAQKQFKSACNISSPVRHGKPKSEILKMRSRMIGKLLSISYQQPLKIVQGALQYLYDEDGKVYLDAVNNVPHVGHCHPKVVKAAQKQMAELNTNTRYLHDYLVEYAEKLTAKFPEPLSVCYFVNSGSEANDLALRLARNFTGQKDVIVIDSAYHGTTTADIEISPYKFDSPGGSGKQKYIHKVEIPDIYRGTYRKDDPEAGPKYAAEIKKRIDQVQNAGSEIAAFIFESLMGVAGQIVYPENYLKTAFKHVKEADGICIADEVQIGFGRVGTRFWGFETQHVVPDIVTLGKPIGNGHPLAAVVTTTEIADAFDNGMEYFNTFGGNPVSCAVGLAVLQVIEEEKLQENALNVGTYLKNQLTKLKNEHPLIGDVRGLGLFIGVELVRDRSTLEPADTEAYHIVERMKDEGVLISTDGQFHNVLKIKPPLVFNKNDADFLVQKLDIVLTETNVR